MNRHAARWILLPCLALMAISAVNYRFWVANQITSDRVVLPPVWASGVAISASRHGASTLDGEEVTWHLHLSPEGLARLSSLDLSYGIDGKDPDSTEWTRVPLGAQDQLRLSLPSPFEDNPSGGKIFLLLRVTSRDGKTDLRHWVLSGE